MANARDRLDWTGCKLLDTKMSFVKDRFRLFPFVRQPVRPHLGVTVSLLALSGRLSEDASRGRGSLARG